MHNDKHCVKMIWKSAQMLSTAHRMLDGEEYLQRNKNHKNHPSTIWARSSKQHYDWLFRLFRMLSAEYSIRYSEHNFKVHKTWDKLGKLLETAPKNIKDNGWVDPPQCMPDHCKRPNTIDAYRNYYMTEKASISTWKFTNSPTWMTL